MKNKKGFTLIELLAVIVILGLLMAIAIPSVTKYITQSRKKTVTSTIGNYISALVNDVNDLSYTFTASNTVYAVPIECIALERGGTNPFGAWHQASNAYWAYVLVQYDDQTSSYTYGYTFKDSAGYGIYPTSQPKLNEQGKQIQTGLDLSRPKTGKVTTITDVDNWNGFKIDSSTDLVVLVAESEGNIGDGTSTCTLTQKGDNYAVVEEEKGEVSGTLIQSGGTYYVGVTSSMVGDYSGATATYVSGDSFPETVNTGDVYVYGDYEYRYNYSWMEGWYKNTGQNGWDVRVIDNTKSSYGEIKEEIAGKPVTNMSATFMGCGNLVVAPAIPKTVTNLTATFCACSSLQRASLPSTVTYIGENGFSYCSSLKDIYYGGTETQWKSIKNYNVDSSIKKATIHYNSSVQ